MATQYSSPREAMHALDSLPVAVEGLAHSPTPANVKAIVNETEAALETLKQHHGEQDPDPADSVRSNGHER
jgi:hypothetical protein